MALSIQKLHVININISPFLNIINSSILGYSHLLFYLCFRNLNDLKIKKNHMKILENAKKKNLTSS